MPCLFLFFLSFLFVLTGACGLCIMCCGSDCLCVYQCGCVVEVGGGGGWEVQPCGCLSVCLRSAGLMREEIRPMRDCRVGAGVAGPSLRLRLRHIGDPLPFSRAAPLRDRPRLTTAGFPGGRRGFSKAEETMSVLVLTRGLTADDRVTTTHHGFCIIC